MNEEKIYWLDKKTNVNKLIIGVLVICVFLLIIDFFYEKHPQVFVEKWMGFYCFYGFLICCVIVVGGKFFRKIVIRKENFYDD